MHKGKYVFAQLLDFIDKDVFLRIAHYCPVKVPDSNEETLQICNEILQSYTYLTCPP